MTLLHVDTEDDNVGYSTLAKHTPLKPHGLHRHYVDFIRTLGGLQEESIVTCGRLRLNVVTIMGTQCSRLLDSTRNDSETLLRLQGPS